MKQSLLLLSFTSFALLLTFARAENWPRFRGPTGQGHSAETKLPQRWSATENVAWKTPIPGAGWSSPIVWEDRLFVTTATDDGATCRLVCLDAANGKIRWDTKLFTQPLIRKETKNSYATPTPCTDGQRVYCAFNDGSLAAVDFDGKIAWTNRDVAFYSRHGLSASPIVHDGLVVMTYDGSNKVDKAGDYPKVSDAEKLGWQTPWDKALVVALDARSGKRVWSTGRGQSRISHMTPGVLGEGAAAQLLSPAGDVVQAFAPRSGKLLWTVRSEGEGVVPSFAAGEGLVFTASGFGNPRIRAVRLGGSGDVTSTHIAWEQNKGVPTQSSLLYVRPYVYAVTDAGVANCFRAADGKSVWTGRIGGTHSASPVAADGRIYILSEQGETTVIEPGDSLKVVARNPLSERCQASMAVSGGRLFIRGERSLFCIEERPARSSGRHAHRRR
jgi:outer membrane protein assembly factor BamB